MDYKGVYERLIQKAVARRFVDGYSEKHHVKPRCLGGTDERANLVVLTAEEHFLAHQLLVKMLPEERGLVFALDKMTLAHNSKCRSNRAYGWIRRKVMCALSSRMKSNNPMSSEASRKRLSVSMTGKRTGEEHPLATKVKCIETGEVFSTRQAAGAWLRSIGNHRAHGGSLSEALRDPAKYSAFGFHWEYA